jgi:hypothetical protein
MLFEIKSRWTGRVLFSLDCETLKLCAEAAVRSGANLADADLTGANLTRANLAGANLTGANLTRANLTRANLAGANLADADLTRADLTGANLAGAYLMGADLTRADLAGANLTDANLTDANLTDANLTGAYLAGANLAGVRGLRIDHILPQIQGTRHRVRMDGYRVIKIGCISKPIEWWLEHSVRCGEEHGYTPEQIAEYRLYIEMIAAMYPATKGQGE